MEAIKMSEIWNNTYTLGNTSATQIVAGEGIKLDTSVPGTIKISNDETVLYEGNKAAELQLSESIKNFKTFKIYMSVGQSLTCYTVHEFDSSAGNVWATVQAWAETTEGSNCTLCCVRFTFDTTTNKINLTNRKLITFGTWNNTTATPSATTLATPALAFKVIGINRISGGN